MFLSVVADQGATRLTARSRFTAKPGVGGGLPPRISRGCAFLETAEGRPLPLIGHNVCWHHEGGTDDYRRWFARMREAGENFARIWMCPWAFGIECHPRTLTNYRQDRAWTLDVVLGLAESCGIYVLLALDYHGMFETVPDHWNANDNWKLNPYNSANGGPCQTPNEFFLSATAMDAYRKRLRYIVARWGHHAGLVAWQFFNEIDNAYRHLQPGDVAIWHAEMSRVVRRIDYTDRLVTTSLTGGSDRSDIWRLPEMYLTSYHSYGLSSPVTKLPAIIHRMRMRYRKPVLVGEFGVDFREWNRESDPYLRGFRQTLWAGALGGSAGTSMSWWWENIHDEGVYSALAALARILRHTTWGTGSDIATGWCEDQAQPSLFSTFTWCAMRCGSNTILYAVNATTNFPDGALLREPVPLTGSILLPNHLIARSARYRANWYDTLQGRRIRVTNPRPTDYGLVIETPEVADDVVGVFKAIP